MKGSTSLDDVAETLGISLPVKEYDTLGGYIFGVLGHIPEMGQHLRWKRMACRFRWNAWKDIEFWIPWCDMKKQNCRKRQTRYNRREDIFLLTERRNFYG